MNESNMMNLEYANVPNERAANHSEVALVMDDLLERIIMDDETNDEQQPDTNKCNNNSNNNIEINNLDILNKMVHDLTQIPHLTKSSSPSSGGDVMKRTTKPQQQSTKKCSKIEQQNIQIDRRCRARLSLRNGAPTIVLERRYSFDSKRSSAEYFPRTKQTTNSHSSAYESAATNSPVQSDNFDDSTRLNESDKKNIDKLVATNSNQQFKSNKDCLNEKLKQTLKKSTSYNHDNDDDDEERTNGNNNGNNNCANCTLCQQVSCVRVAPPLIITTRMASLLANSPECILILFNVHV